MSSNFDDVNLVQLTGKRVKKRRNKRGIQRMQGNLVFNPFATSYRTAPNKANAMSTGPNSSSAAYQERSQQHSFTETIDLSDDMECDNMQTHSETKLSNKIGSLDLL